MAQAEERLLDASIQSVEFAIGRQTQQRTVGAASVMTSASTVSSLETNSPVTMFLMVRLSDIGR